MGSVTNSMDVGIRRLRSANFYVLKWAECPAVLVELGYLSNHQDAMKLKSIIHKDRLVEALAKGLIAYKEEFERTDGFTK